MVATLPRLESDRSNAVKGVVLMTAPFLVADCVLMGIFGALKESFWEKSV
jgi:hypothetical protein